MYIYLDYVFLINIVMNSLLLLMTAWASGRRYSYSRVFVAASVGAFYVLGGVLPQFALFYNAIGKLIISFFIVFVAFGCKSVKDMVLLIGIFYIVSFVFGGAVLGWFYFWQTSGAVNEKLYSLKNISWDSLLGGSIIGVVLLLIVAKRMIVRISRKRNFYMTTAEYNGRSIYVNGLLDTGNSLCTFGGRPVIIVNREALEPLLPPLVAEYLRKNDPSSWIANLENCNDEQWLSRIEVIPYKSVGNQSMLLGFRPDRCSIAVRNSSISYSDVVIGVYSGRLASDGTYAALLHPELLNRNSNQNGEASICA